MACAARRKPNCLRAHRGRHPKRRVIAIFGVTALAWVFREMPVGGWSSWLGLPGATDTGVALCGALAMLLVSDGRGGDVLTWQDAERLPWGVLVLFGGGIARSMAFQSSGLSTLMATQLKVLADLPLILMLVMIVGSVVLLSEIVSNTATAVLLMPIMATAPNLIAYGSGRVPAPRRSGRVRRAR